MGSHAITWIIPIQTGTGAQWKEGEAQLDPIPWEASGGDTTVSSCSYQSCTGIAELELDKTIFQGKLGFFMYQRGLLEILCPVCLRAAAEDLRRRWFILWCPRVGLGLVGCGGLALGWSEFGLFTVKPSLDKDI